ncbi:MAG TPA: sugar-transfer associated ATP-grasp domain-containing protein, partial [Gammaproteobacteria bacterium]|nr:sugar-transfer associated ATP-grasp domain-containing protein [Gammaproteobacteria bacterium]
MLLARYRAMSTSGVLGMNKRNGDYIMRFNPRRLYPLVDDKLLTKKLAMQAGIAVPELYGVIETQHDIRNLERIVGRHAEFALKPAHGSGGDGIVVIAGRSGAKFRTVGGTLLDPEYLAHHLSNAINGQFSLGGVPDVVIVEY